MNKEQSFKRTNVLCISMYVGMKQKCIFARRKRVKYSPAQGNVAFHLHWNFFNYLRCHKQKALYTPLYENEKFDSKIIQWRLLGRVGYQRIAYSLIVTTELPDKKLQKNSETILFLKNQCLFLIYMITENCDPKTFLRTEYVSSFATTSSVSGTFFGNLKIISC